MNSVRSERNLLPAGGAVGSLVLGAAAVSGLLGAGIAGFVSVLLGASVFEPLVPAPLVDAVPFFFLLKNALSLSMMSEAADEFDG